MVWFGSFSLFEFCIIQSLHFAYLDNSSYNCIFAYFPSLYVLPLLYILHISVLYILHFVYFTFCTFCILHILHFAFCILHILHFAFCILHIFQDIHQIWIFLLARVKSFKLRHGHESVSQSVTDMGRPWVR